MSKASDSASGSDDAFTSQRAAETVIAAEPATPAELLRLAEQNGMIEELRSKLEDELSVKEENWEKMRQLEEKKVDPGKFLPECPFKFKIIPSAQVNLMWTATITN